MTKTEAQRTQLLQKRFGMKAFRSWQHDAVREILDGSGQALVIAPTGGGKSLCFQYPATELAGTTIVISPLIALMEDQVRSLQDRGIPATYLASNLDVEERQKRWRELRDGQYRLVYISPERLAQRGTIQALRQLQSPFIAIDEAHCISQWGHDFRPDYLRLGKILQELKPARVLACTATATPTVRQEIVERLALHTDSRVILRGFARPNLHLAAEEVSGRGRPTIIRSAVRERLGSPDTPQGAAIIYAATRRQTEQLAAALERDHWRVAAYHAGMAPEERSAISHAFANGELDIVTATNAFGMGIDRPDIRLVVHSQSPSSIEAYYQEVGRAGRDGQPAWGLLLSSASDIGLRRRLIEFGGRDGQAPSADQIKRQWDLFLELLRYIDAGSCRHDFILRYFGDDQELLGGCGHCDVCEALESAEATPRDDQQERETTVRKALSGVARVRRRAGLNAIAEMLRGEKTERMRRLELDQLSTYGLFADFDKPWTLSLLRRLLAAGLIDVTASDFPVPYLTATGIETMKGQRAARILLPQKSAKKSTKGKRTKLRREPPADMDTLLFENLRAARLEIAKSQGVPAYVICHDRTLMEIAAKRPTDENALSDVFGMGPARMEAYGTRLLAVVQAS